MGFKVSPLVSGGYLVEGEDTNGTKGSTLLVSPAWDAYQAILRHKQAEEVFSAEVGEFFKPLLDAADRAKAVAHPDTRDWSRVVVTEGTEGKDSEVVELDSEGVLLRILTETDGSMLRWIGTDTLVALA